MSHDASSAAWPPNYPDSHDPTGPPSTEELLGESSAATCDCWATMGVDGEHARDCPAATPLELRYVVADGSANGKEVRVPLHDCDIVRGHRKLATFRQNGWMTTEAFRSEWPVYSTSEVDDLGDA